MKQIFLRTTKDSEVALKKALCVYSDSLTTLNSAFPNLDFLLSSIRTGWTDFGPSLVNKAPPLAKDL